jgi:pantetheine-phosphate adenylyltransferase
MTFMKTALIAGSFDPITMGHYDIIKRASALFDRVIVCIFQNANKSGEFSIERRLELLKLAISDLPNVSADSSDALLADYVEEHKIDAVVKGIRNAIDFDYEWNMAMINRHFSSKVETVFLPANNQYLHISSSLVRELLHRGKPIADYLPPRLRNTTL